MSLVGSLYTTIDTALVAQAPAIPVYHNGTGAFPAASSFNIRIETVSDDEDARYMNDDDDEAQALAVVIEARTVQVTLGDNALDALAVAAEKAMESIRGQLDDLVLERTDFELEDDDGIVGMASIQYTAYGRGVVA